MKRGSCLIANCYSSCLDDVLRKPLSPVFDTSSSFYHRCFHVRCIFRRLYPSELIVFSGNFIDNCFEGKIIRRALAYDPYGFFHSNSGTPPIYPSAHNLDNGIFFLSKSSVTLIR